MPDDDPEPSSASGNGAGEGKGRESHSDDVGAVENKPREEEEEEEEEEGGSQEEEEEVDEGEHEGVTEEKAVSEAKIPQERYRTAPEVARPETQASPQESQRTASESKPATNAPQSMPPGSYRQSPGAPPGGYGHATKAQIPSGTGLSNQSLRKPDGPPGTYHPGRQSYQGYQPSTTSHQPPSSHMTPSTTSHQPPTTSYQPSGMTYQPSSASYQPSASSAASYQPAATTSYQPSAGSYQPSVTTYQPSTPSYQSTTPSYQPSATSHQSSPSYQSTTPGYQPSTSSYQSPYQPSASSYQSPSSTYQSSTSNYQSYQSSAGSYQPSPASHSLSQLKGDISRSPGMPYQNTAAPNLQSGMMSGANQMQRSYPSNTGYGEQNRSMNPTGPRPQMSQPGLNRAPFYPTASSQRLLPENYQKTPSAPAARTGFTAGQTSPSTNPQYYSPSTPTARSGSLSTTVAATGLPSTLSDRMYKSDPAKGDFTSKLKTQNPSLAGDSKFMQPSQEPSKVVRPNVVPESYQKKPEVEEAKPAPVVTPEQPEPKTVTSEKPTAKPEDAVEKTEGEEKDLRNGPVGKPEDKAKETEVGIVHANVKFFEERDTAKVPLTPTRPSPAKSFAMSRSATFVSDNVVKGEHHGRSDDEDDCESGIDVTPLLHPNLRRIIPDRPFDIYGRSGREGNSASGRRGRKQNRPGVNSSCPPTPIKHHPSDHIPPGILKVPKSKSHKNIVEFSPEEELLYFFSMARSQNPSARDRNSGRSRLENASAKKENVPTTNGDVHAPKKTPTKLPAPAKRSSSASSPTKTPLKSPGVPKSLPKTPDSPAPQTPLIKKVPMNKIQVGAAPSPNLKAVKSKIGSLANTTHKPGGGNIKIESHKMDFSKAQSRIEAKNDTYAPGGGDKKIQQVKLQWSAKPKVGSLENATHKPGGGDKKIESVKLDFKDKAKPKVGSKDNVKHVPGGGTVKIESQKLEFKAQSKVGSLDNVKHKPGGGDIKIFDDKTYLKQVSCGSSEGRASGTQSYCDLSVVSEVHSISAPGTPHHGTAIKIRKSTTLARSKPEICKTTEVTVVSRSPSIEKKGLAKSPSRHEVRLTYSAVSSPKRGKSDLDNVGPVEVVNVPAAESAAIIKPVYDRPDESPMEVKNLISSFEQHITNNKGLPPFTGDAARAYPKTRPESAERKVASHVNEELNQRFMPVKEELDRVNQDKSLRAEEASKRHDDEDGESMSKFLRNEIAAHEKVGEMWKEVHNIGPDKPSPGTTEETVPPPPPPTPSVAQKPAFQQQQQQQQQHSQLPPKSPQQNPRFQGPPTNPQQYNNPNVQRPPQMQNLQMPQRPPMPKSPTQGRPPSAMEGQRPPIPGEQTSGMAQYQNKPGPMPQKITPSTDSPHGTQQPIPNPAPGVMHK